MSGWLDTLIQGVLLGGLYALFAMGLSLIFGVMRLVNIAHGDLIVLAAYLALVVVNATGLNPLAALAICVPAMFLLGYALQRGLLNFTLGGDILPPLLVTFGLSIIIQNALLQGFSADPRASPLRSPSRSNCCSRAFRWGAPFAPPPMTRKPRSSWA
jgi:branched-chain amino acid transport system permease protein